MRYIVTVEGTSFGEPVQVDIEVRASDSTEAEDWATDIGRSAHGLRDVLVTDCKEA